MHYYVCVCVYTYVSVMLSSKMLVKTGCYLSHIGCSGLTQSRSNKNAPTGAGCSMALCRGFEKRHRLLTVSNGKGWSEASNVNTKYISMKICRKWINLACHSLCCFSVSHAYQTELREELAAALSTH